MAIVLTNKNNDMTKAEYINQVYHYAIKNDLFNVYDLIDNTVEDGLNQIYNIVANESPIECVNYDFTNSQTRDVAKWIDEHVSDIREALIAAGNYDVEDDVPDFFDEIHYDTDEGEDKIDNVSSLIKDCVSLIQKELNAKSELEKAEVVVGTNELVNNILKLFK